MGDDAAAGAGHGLANAVNVPGKDGDQVEDLKCSIFLKKKPVGKQSWGLAVLEFPYLGFALLSCVAVATLSSYNIP